MNILRIILLAVVALNIAPALAAGYKSSCVVKAQDPVIQTFFRSKGYDVDDDKGEFQVEFEATCEAIEKKKEKFSSTEVHQTTIKLEIFVDYGEQRVTYHSESLSEKSGRVESSMVIPCLDTKEMKQKLLEKSLKTIQDINCDEIANF